MLEISSNEKAFTPDRGDHFSNISSCDLEHLTSIY